MCKVYAVNVQLSKILHIVCEITKLFENIHAKNLSCIQLNSNLFTQNKSILPFPPQLLHMPNMRYDEEVRRLIWHDLENRLRKHQSNQKYWREPSQRQTHDQSNQSCRRQPSQSQSQEENNQEDRGRRLRQIAGMMPIPRIG